MSNLQPILETLIVGMGMSVALFWIAFMWGRLSTDMADFKWWLRVIVPQSLALAALLKIFKVF